MVGFCLSLFKSACLRLDELKHFVISYWHYLWPFFSIDKKALLCWNGGFLNFPMNLLSVLLSLSELKEKRIWLGMIPTRASLRFPMNCWSNVNRWQSGLRSSRNCSRQNSWPVYFGRTNFPCSYCSSRNWTFDENHFGLFLKFNLIRIYGWKSCEKIQLRSWYKMPLKLQHLRNKCFDFTQSFRKNSLSPELSVHY